MTGIMTSEAKHEAVTFEKSGTLTHLAGLQQPEPPDMTATDVLHPLGQRDAAFNVGLGRCKCPPQMLRRIAVFAIIGLWSCGPTPNETDGGPEDAGALDSGAPDAGRVDAGTDDAGSDAGPIDGGSSDAGLSDGGSDAGPVDGGASDAGALDGGDPSDAGQIDGGGIDDGGADAGQLRVDAGELVVVGHARELRGVWVATVSNLDFPSRANLTMAQQQQELARIVEVTADAGLNAIFFQVRPESDALYTSTREPWSRFLTGTQGVNPGYDPLAHLIPLAHAQGLEVHAWVNPYRAKSNFSSVAASGHISQQLAQHAITYPSGASQVVVMDPSAKPVRDWVVAEVGHLVSQYDVDGLHFDDYFYPYPSGTPAVAFPDEMPYQTYQADGGTLGKTAWRRENVNALVREVSQVVTSTKPDVRFGIGPFGIYRPGQPMGIMGLDAYEAIACDPLAWLAGGWVDYIAPQLYWPTTRQAQRFDLLIDWWSQRPMAGQNIFAGLAGYQVGTTAEWPLSEFRTQVTLARAKSPGVQGQLWFRFTPLANNMNGLRTLVTELYGQPALPPPVAARSQQMIAAPNVTTQGGLVTVQHPAPTSLKGYSLYAANGPGWSLARIVPGPSAQLTLTQGIWAIAAVSRASVESLGVVVIVP